MSKRKVTIAKRAAVSSTAVPRIRFKGCEGEWGRVFLSQILSVSDELNESGQFVAEDVFSVSREYGVVNQIEYQGRSFAGASLRGYRVIRQGQIAYTKSPLKDQPYGIIKTNKVTDGIVSSLYGVYSTIGETSPAFVQVYFERDDRLNDYLRPIINKGAKNTILVSDAGALAGHVTFPGGKEQREISQLFESLGAMLIVAKRRVGELRQLKQSMLVKMFPQRGKTIPEIRFSGFKDEWIEKKLSELSERVTRKNTELQSDLPLTISAEQGLIDQREIFNNRIAAKNVSNYYLVRRGEFAYNRSTSEGHPWGAVKRLDKYEMGVLSTLYMVFSLNEDSVDSEYLVHYYSTVLWHSDVARCAAEGARNHGLLNVSVEDFFSTHVLLPRSVAEQQKIGSFFKNLDSLIATAEKRVAKLRQVKASLLERMFV